MLSSERLMYIDVLYPGEYEIDYVKQRCFKEKKCVQIFYILLFLKKYKDLLIEIMFLILSTTKFRKNLWT